MSASMRAFRLEEVAGEGAKAVSGRKVFKGTFDLPGEKVNKLSRQAMQDFEWLLGELEALHKAGRIDALLVFSGKPGNFIAGADIELIQSAQSAAEAESLSRMGQQLLNRWEDLPFPTIAAVDGAALGGGLEVALACSAFVMSDNPAARIGLPEVMLGFIPGMGGCVRLPRKVGIATALDLILTGKTLDGKKAYRAGIADGCVSKEAFELSALRWVGKNWEKIQARSRLAPEPKWGGMGGTAGRLLEGNPLGRAFIFKKAREGVLQKTRGQYPAPLEALETLRSNGAKAGPRLAGTERDRALAREAQGFGKCAVTEVSRHLVRLFFMMEAIKKTHGVADPSVKPLPTQSVGVLGAGVMGGGIAQLLADKGIPARMKDVQVAGLQAGLKAASDLFRKKLKRKRLTEREFAQKMNLISPALDYSGFGSLGLVVEAIIEKMDLKKKVFQELEGQVSESCVLVSNTSSLSISEMQGVLRHPERFAGMHFFNPVHKMPLVEVIRGSQTSDQTVATVFDLSRKLGKTPVVVKDAPGFLVNRLLMPYLNEATWMVSEGTPVDELDEAMLEFGMPMGPMELIDEVGIDVGEKVAHILHDAFGDRMTPSPLNAKVVATGRLGKKTQKGIYDYGVQGKSKQLDPRIYEAVGVTPRPGAMAAEEMVERCVLPMINEASRCLTDGIVETASDLDLAMIMGTGFPPFRGGLLRYADSLGARHLVDRLRHYEKRFGARFAPSETLLKMAQSGTTFHAEGGAGEAKGAVRASAEPISPGGTSAKA
jgi:3-hydroxyacyl-CoA dehydrogenase/enoyl-CoA hydratase/3-hydroxybutyryl-CoA epimerase